MNWDKPLESTSGYFINTFNKHHGTNFNDWSELATLLEVEIERDVINYHKKFHEAYLNYCKLMSSPLGKALS